MCGKCFNCKVIYKMEWSTRLEHELEMKQEGLFGTFTYNDEHLPPGSNLDPEHLKELLRKLRRYFKYRNIAFSYYAIGDYGEKLGRPHYHFLMFGIGKSDPIWNFHDWEKGQCACKQWIHGFVHVSTMTLGRIKYVTGYVTKESKSLATMESIGASVKPFRFMSHGIGKQFLLRHMASLKSEQVIYKRGAPVKLPRYYRKILEIKDPEISDRLRERAYLENKAKLPTQLTSSVSISEKNVSHYNHQRSKQFAKNTLRRNRDYTTVI